MNRSAGNRHFSDLPRPNGDRGAGLIGTIGGVLVFLTLLTFAVQLLFNLYATSVVTAVAYDTASIAAAGTVERSDPVSVNAAVQHAEDQGRRLLGRSGEDAEFTWDLNPDRIRLTIRIDHPKLALEKVSGAFGLNRIERSVVVRVETPR